jgi:hypothetical protein
MELDSAAMRRKRDQNSLPLGNDRRLYGRPVVKAEQ